MFLCFPVNLQLRYWDFIWNGNMHNSGACIMQCHLSQKRLVLNLFQPHINTTYNKEAGGRLYAALSRLAYDLVITQTTVRTTLTDDICHLRTASCLISHQICLWTTLRMTYVVCKVVRTVARSSAARAGNSCKKTQVPCTFELKSRHLC